MAEEAQKGLLTLLRELRDNVYEHLFTTVAASAGNSNHNNPEMELFGLPSPSLLKVCRQLHTGCSDLMNKATLKLELTDNGFYEPLSLLFKPSFPVARLAAVKKCSITLHWSELIKSDVRLPIFVEWYKGLTPKQLRLQETLRWTPAKHMCAHFKNVLRKVEPILHASAAVGIAIVLNGLPDASDPYTFGVAASAGKEIAPVIGAAIHLKTVKGMETDTSIAWPVAGKLRVRAIAFDPLYESLPKNHEQVTRDRMALRAGQSVKLVEPDTVASELEVLWEMHPTDGGDGWNGYDPEFIEMRPNDAHCGFSMGYWEN